MKIEWDSAKAGANLDKPGVAFEDALTVFQDPLATTFVDPDHSVGEDRFLTVGYASDERLLVVAHSDDGETIRIISARPATAHERRRHEA